MCQQWRWRNANGRLRGDVRPSVWEQLRVPMGEGAHVIVVIPLSTLRCRHCEVGGGRGGGESNGHSKRGVTGEDDGRARRAQGRW